MLAAPLERAGRSRAPRRLRLVLPIALILLALLAALYVSGVFGADDPATPSVSAPTAAPVEAGLDAVPGAEEATADAIETAKARARGEDVPAAKKQKRAAEPKRAPAATSPAPAAANPPPPAPAVSANNPANPPPPPPEREPESSEEKQIDAGSGATGSEQIPPAADASDVPDLAPPTDPGTTP